MVQSIRWLMVFGAWAPAMLIAQAPPPPSGVYTCVDAKGRKLTSDRPIAECVDREQRVLNPSGTVQAKVVPELTGRERADQEARERKEAEARAMQVEEKRRERALLVRYPSREVHDKERNEAVAKVAVVTQAANRRIGELALERRKLDQEMEFYKNDPTKAPLALRRQIDDLAQSVAIPRRFIAEQDTEVRRINARFDEELARLGQLWVAQAATRPPVATVKKSP
ncbi:MAG: DUF4124 domain-containing protein [Rhodoferax sp.]|nr:DUF4124 domain-containing protein [Rhodoferax sp.]